MQLREYLDQHQIGLPEFARSIDVSVQSVHRYVAGERVPAKDVMSKIARVTGGKVQPNDFYPVAA